jgi:hypothetical protein
MHGERTDGPQGVGPHEAATAVAQSREAAERLWAEIGRLLAAARPADGVRSGITR